MLHVRTLVADALQQLRSEPDYAERIEANPPTLQVPADGLELVRLDRMEIAVAVTAVLRNAMLAVEDAGAVTIEAVAAPDGKAVLLRVIDTGVGMSDHTLRHAADPFFSFQPAGRRRGMGLAIAARVLEAAGGSLHLESKLGEGTSATLRLPIVDATELTQAA